MSRWISLFVLLTVIALTSVVLYRVMASFVLPLFLAAVLTVIFRPLHMRVVDRMKNRPGLAALVTTGLILTTVLLPLVVVTTLAIREALGAIGGDVVDRAEVRIARLREHLNLEVPFHTLLGADDEDSMSLVALDGLMETLPASLPEFENIDAPFRQQLDEISDGLHRLDRRLSDTRYLAAMDSDDSDDSPDMKRVKRMVTELGAGAFEPIREMRSNIDLTRRFAAEGPDAFPIPNPYRPSEVERQHTEAAGETRGDAGDTSGSAKRMQREEALVDVAELRRLYRRIPAGYAAFRMDLAGGPFWSWLTDLVNPSREKFDSWLVNLHSWLRGLLPSVAGQATAMVGGSVFGLAIIALAIFYFLKDGPAMIQTLMKLSPLDDRYEEELVSEFEAVSRAVVLATLLSALAQGVLAGIAYFFAGFDSVFLMMSLTVVFALVPFIGAAAVWFPACLWLAVVDERYVAAIVMFVYGVSVVSMVDNLIKPYVLHGQSKLHPLLALLSVLGGVQALGPIGILVGPMVVSFLQALLNILQHELQELDTPPITSS